MEIGRPIIAVSLNYRVGGWGFIASKEVVEDGSSNIGLFDQRLALKWINENIKAFGGDPSKVTIAGESAGAFSVGYHLVAFDGQSDGLFRAAIMQSGNALGPGSMHGQPLFQVNKTTNWDGTVNSIRDLADTYEPIYDNVTTTVGCSDAADSLQCLRMAPYEALFEAFAPFVLTPIIDGQFLSRLPSESFAQGLVADVAILAGSNTDEGTATFFGPRGTLETDSDVQSLLSAMGRGLDNDTVEDLMHLYPDDPSQGCPFNTGSERFAQNGYQFKRGAAIVGDEVIHAGRRFTTTYFSKLPSHRRKPVYSYRFDQSPWDGSEELVATEAPVFSTHYAEICFVFNIEPSASKNNSNWIGPFPEYYRLSKQMSRTWISFTHDLNPNRHGMSGIPKWPDYSCSKKNLVFRADGNYVEKDDWRESQLQYWGSIWQDLKT